MTHRTQATRADGRVKQPEATSAPRRPALRVIGFAYGMALASVLQHAG